MLEFILRRAMLLIPVLFLISVISFSLIHLAPGDVAENALQSPSGGADAQAIVEYREKMGLDRPIYVQYLAWLDRALHGDLGYSYMTGEDVAGAIARCFGATVKLAIVSMAFSLLFSIPLGIAAGIWHDRPIDHLSRLVSLVGAAIPNFWLGYLLMIVFGVTCRILPTSGYGDGGDLQHMILPAVTLGVAYAAYNMRLLRAGMIEALGQEYVKAARAKGLRERAVIFRHALRNALIPFVTFAGLNLGYLLNGSMIVETIFSWPGIGDLFVSSIYLKDFPMVEGCILAIALVYVAVNLAVDVSYLLIDPRVRYAASN